MSTLATVFDTEALRRGIEERDARTLSALYAPDAEMTVVDSNTPPSGPRVLRGRTAIGEYLDDVCGRDMTHRLERVVVSGDTAAFTQACRYPDGTSVLCLAMLDLRDGLIARQATVQAWDTPQGTSPSPSPATQQPTQRKDFAAPDEVRTFGLGRVELLKIGDSEIGLLVLQPGWRWSEHVKPIAGTELCEAPHFQYHVAGTLRIKTADGTEFDAGPGQVTSLPAGHDAWVVGNEDVVIVDWWGASDYAS
jgi:ketosteroid isomerase-like protein